MPPSARWRGSSAAPWRPGASARRNATRPRARRAWLEVSAAATGGRGGKAGPRRSRRFEQSRLRPPAGGPSRRLGPTWLLRPRARARAMPSGQRSRFASVANAVGGGGRVGHGWSSFDDLVELAASARSIRARGDRRSTSRRRRASPPTGVEGHSAGSAPSRSPAREPRRPAWTLDALGTDDEAGRLRRQIRVRGGWRTVVVVDQPSSVRHAARAAHVSARRAGPVPAGLEGRRGRSRAEPERGRLGETTETSAVHRGDGRTAIVRWRSRRRVLAPPARANRVPKACQRARSEGRRRRAGTHAPRRRARPRPRRRRRQPTCRGRCRRSSSRSYSAGSARPRAAQAGEIRSSARTPAGTAGAGALLRPMARAPERGDELGRRRGEHRRKAAKRELPSPSLLAAESAAVEDEDGPVDRQCGERHARFPVLAGELGSAGGREGAELAAKRGVRRLRAGKLTCCGASGAATPCCCGGEDQVGLNRALRRCRDLAQLTGLRRKNCMTEGFASKHRRQAGAAEAETTALVGLQNLSRRPLTCTPSGPPPGELLRAGPRRRSRTRARACVSVRPSRCGGRGQHSGSAARRRAPPRRPESRTPSGSAMTQVLLSSRTRSWRSHC